MLDKLLLNSGSDIPVPSMGLEIRQPSLMEIAKFGEQNLYKVLNLINYSKEDYLEHLDNQEKEGKISPEAVESVKTDLMFMTDFQLILEAAKEEDSLKDFFISLFYLLIPASSKVVIEEDRFVSISFREGQGKNLILSEDMFSEFRTIVLEMFLMSGEDKNGFNPVDERAAEIAKKLEERHRRLAIEKGEHNKETSTIATNASILSSMANISLREIYQYTLPQLYQQLDRTTKYSAYENQITLGAFGGLKDVEMVDFRESI